MSANHAKSRKLLTITPDIQLDQRWNELPCQPCPMLERCGLGNKTSPVTCKLMNDWLSSLLKDRKNGGTLDL